ncbi:MAG: glycosyltransferase family 2 protein [bacterium]|nr:glycosyltransferase family 2 protein [bacterium]
MSDTTSPSSVDAQTTDMRTGLAAVVPCYNVGDRVVPVLEALVEMVDHVLVLNDGSTDGIGDRIQGLPVQYIDFAENRGKGFVLIDGLRAAREIPGIHAVATIDSDGQHDPEELPGLYEALVRDAADLVIGSRVFDESQVPWRSRVGNKMTITLTGLLLGQRVPDTQSGYRLHSMPLVDHILETVPGGRYETEMEILARAIRDGFKVLPAPIQTIYEAGNKSSHFSVLRDPFLIYKKLFKMGFAKGRKRSG